MISRMETGTGKTKRKEGKYLVTVKPLEQLNGLLEVVHDFSLWGVVVVALRLERADAGAVLAPLVLPEGLIIALVVFPIGVHVGQKVILAV
jgi:hypothetical protein